jgi:hypothetical protein
MDLDELERLLKQATPGPWIEMETHPYLFANPRGPQPWHHDIVGRFDYHSDANRALIAALRNHAEELVRDARRMEWAATNLVDVTVICGTDLVQRAWCLDSKSGPSVEGATLREAIDAAIAQEQPPDVPDAEFGNMAGGD